MIRDNTLNVGGRMSAPGELWAVPVPYEPASRRPIARLFRRTANSAVRICVRRGIHPDTVSCLSVVASAGAAACLLYSVRWPWLLLIAPLFCYVRLWLNMLDGMVALAAQKASRRGEIFNELPDRVSDVVVLVALAHAGWMSWPLLAYWAALGAVLTAYVGMLGQAVGARREFGGIMAKPMRMVMVHLAAWGTFAVWMWGGDRKFGGLSVLDWGCIIIVAGCVQTSIVRLASTFRLLKIQSVAESQGISAPQLRGDASGGARVLCPGVMETNGGAEGSTSHTFQTWDGAELFYRAWTPAGKIDRAVMLFHRGHEHSGRWAETVAGLHAQLGKEVAIFAWDQRGHGRSPGARGSAPSVAAIVKDAEMFSRHLMAEHGVRMEETVIVAHSVGAVVALAWVHDYAPPLRGLVLATPALEVKLYVPLAIPALRMKQRVTGPGYVSSYIKAKMLTHDLAEQAAYQADPLIFKQIAVNVLLELFDLSKRLIADAGAIRVPTLILAAGKDWVVKRGAQWNLFERLSSPVKQMEVLEGMYHSVFHESGRGAVVERVGRFIGECFDRPNERESEEGRRALLEADRGGYTRSEYDRLRAPGSLKWKMARGFLKTMGRLSEGVRLGWRTGFDSGLTLDYVYANRARGNLGVGKLIDRNYLNAIGWRGIRIRRENLCVALRSAMGELRARGRGVRVLDVASGPGRYVLETLAESRQWGIHGQAVLRDYKEENLQAARELAAQLGLKEQVRVEWGDATDQRGVGAVRYSVADSEADALERAGKVQRLNGHDSGYDQLAELPRDGGERATIAIVSGLYELFPENDGVRRSLAGIAEAVEEDGYLIYTCQPWHPQVELIARTLTNREGNPWVMRRRTQSEMDALVREAGFEKVSQTIDDWGIFTVSVARRRQKNEG